MSDSESSIDSFIVMERTMSVEVGEPMPTTRNNGDNDKLEEFEKLLRSMMESRGPSLEEEEGDPEEGNDDKIAGIPQSRIFQKSKSTLFQQQGCKIQISSE